MLHESKPRRAWWSLLHAMAVLGAAPTTLAQPSANLDTTLTYQAPAGCPGELTFKTQVQARTTRLRFDPAAAHSLTVVIQSDSTGFVGRLFHSQAGLAPEQPISAATCDEVVAGLALMAALTADSQASSVAEPPPPPPRSPPPRRLQRAPDAKATQVRPRFWMLGASVGARSGLLSTVSPGVSLELGTGTPGSNAFSRAPHAYLALGYTPGGEAGKPGLAAAFRLSTLSIEVCPLLLDLGSSSLGACVRAEAGALTAKLEPSKTLNRLWSNAGVAAHADVLLGSHLFLAARAGGAASITRERFYFRPDQVAYATPALLGHLAVTAGFWWH